MNDDNNNNNIQQQSQYNDDSTAAPNAITEGEAADNSVESAAGTGEKPSKGKKKRKHLIKTTWLRRTLKTLMWIFIVIISLPIMVYIPPIQSALKDLACSVLEESTGMKVEIETFRLAFPIDVKLENLVVVDAQQDTMVRAKSLIADVKLFPLFKGDVQINDARLERGYYHMVNADSSLYLTIDAGYLKVDGGSSMNLKSQGIELKNPVLKDAKVNLLMDVWKAKPDSVVEPSTMVIRSGSIQLENVTYNMKMLPLIADLNADFKKAEIKDFVLDLKNSLVDVGSVIADGGGVKYITPTAEYISAHPMPVDTISPPSPPMEVKLRKLDLKNFTALYATEGVQPADGFDAGYIEVSDLDLSLKDFYNCSSTVKVPITMMKGRERCGIDITSASGIVEIDSTGIAIDNFAVRTADSQLDFDALLTYEMMELKPEGELKAKGSGSLGFRDIGSFMPSLKAILFIIPGSEARLDLDAAGTLANLNVDKFKLDIPGFLNVDMGGWVQNALDFDNLKMRLDLDGALRNASPVNKLLGGTGASLPPFSLSGRIEADRASYSADLVMKSPNGNLALDGNLNLSAEKYEAEILAHNLDVGALMPSLGVGVVDGRLYASGAGFNPSTPGAKAYVEGDISRLDYGGFAYGPLTLDASLGQGAFDLALASLNQQMDLDLLAKGAITGGVYDIDAAATIHHLDLKAIGMMDDICVGSGSMTLKGSANPESMLFDIAMGLSNVDWRYGEEHILLPHAADAKFVATADSTTLQLGGDGLDLSFVAAQGLEKLMDSFSAASERLDAQISAKSVDFKAIQQALPPFDLSASIGGKGILRQFIEPTGYSFKSLNANFSNSGTLRGDMTLSSLSTGTMRLDSIHADFRQKEERMNYRVHLVNRPPNMPEFADVKFTGYVGGNRGSLALRQKNSLGEEGYKLGLTAAMADSSLSVHLTPVNAIIAYKPWTINPDNYVELGPGKTIKARLDAQTMGSSISLVSGMTEANNNYIDLNIKDVRIADFLQMVAVAPPVKGVLNTDLHIELRPKGVIGRGSLAINELFYDKMRVGNLGADFRAGTNLQQALGGKIDFSLDNEHIMALRGYSLPDSVTGDSRTRIVLDLDTFPLKIANPFLGKDVAQLEGFLNGELKVDGGLTSPLLNGDLTTSGVGVFVPMIGSTIRIGDGEAMTVADNLIKFNDVALKGASGSPLMLGGTIDARKLSDIGLDLTLGGRNVILVDNDRRARSDIFGKLAVNLDASVKGTMSKMKVDANLSVLSSTNITYVFDSDPAELQRQNTTGVVKFVQLNDTTQVAKADSIPSSMLADISATLSVTKGATLTVNLNSSGTNRARIYPNGTLRYTQSYLGDSSLTGQLYISEGQVRYTPPLMTEKVFDFSQDSYVSWSGDMMNPALNLKATDHMKANVQQQGSNSRLIYFDIALSVLGTLSAPKVSFDLSTDDDLAVHNELLSMTPEQRSNEAMNLLLYNTYTGPGVTGSSNLTGNPLYSFLSGQLNAWAARTIRGVDLNFGIDQYKNTYDGETSTATSYSYQVSKSLFDNRFKIVVGGNYTTNASGDENFVQNLISDISFEYMLKQSRSTNLYLRLFRHTGWESILEGEVTETGVGVVMKRKIDNLLHLFRLRRPKVAIVPPDSVQDEQSAIVEVADSMTTTVISEESVKQ